MTGVAKAVSESRQMRYYFSRRLIDTLAEEVSSLFPKKCLEGWMQELIEQDFRLAPILSEATSRQDAELLRLLRIYADVDQKELRPEASYQLALSLYYKNRSMRSQVDYVELPLAVGGAGRTGASRSSMNVLDESYAGSIQGLVDDVSGAVGQYIEGQFDLPGINSLVRRGLVKYVPLPGGVIAVSKRENPAKPGRLAQDIENARQIAERLDQRGGRQRLANGSDVSVVQPFAIYRDEASGFTYTLSERVDAPTLEELLIFELDPKKREEFLADCRSLLDQLYDCGILWNDMAPRNILVEESDSGRRYSILDFEKTELIDLIPVLEDRKAHCRGPVCCEEFIAVCQRDEIEQAFGDYFAPRTWDTQSFDPMCFKPRREVRDVFKLRGVENYTLGQYNALDLQILGIREPYLDVESQRRFLPAHINFKVDHYLGSEYDSRCTEVLLHAQRHGMICDAVERLQERIWDIEQAILIAEIHGASELSDDDSVERALLALKSEVDRLYVPHQAASDVRRELPE